MTVDKVIERVKKGKSGYPTDDDQLIDYIVTVEHMILTDIVRGREGDAEEFERISGKDFYSDRDYTLFAAPPFDVIYEQYAATQLDLLAEDGDRYMNDMIVFKNTYTDLKRDWWRKHRQKRNYFYH